MGFAVREIVGAGGGGGALTVTVTDCPALPPAPRQIRVKVLVEVKGRVISLSAVALGPDQASAATHVVAFCDDQLSVAVAPAVTDVGLALKNVIVGGGGGSVPATSTVTDSLAVPPGPVQDKIKTLVIVSGPTVSLPRLPFAPNHAPEASQRVALRTSHSSLEEPLMSTDDGVAVSDMAGA